MKKRPAPGIQSFRLRDLPLALLVENNSKITSADQLWRQDRIEQPLICLPQAETLCKHFQQGLRRLEVDWFAGIEVSSTDLIETYVANGFGIGLSVVVPKGQLAPNIRALPLSKTEFSPVFMGTLWPGKTSPFL